jgi:hypothetical protein
MEEVKSVWAEELGQFVGDDLREALGVATKHYPDYPPTLPQFVNLCRDARKSRAQTVTKLPSDRGVPCPPEIKAQMDKFLRRVKA